MITPQQAEFLAAHHMQEYVNACGCKTPQDVANALTKLVSVCGSFMCPVAGHQYTVGRMQEITDFIAQHPEFETKLNVERQSKLEILQ